MRVLCEYNTPDNVPDGVPNDFDFGLEVGKEYLVMAQLVTKGQLWYLVDENSRPSFYPNQLFRIVDASVSNGWFFKLYAQDDGVYPFEKEMIWGYHELVFDSGHYERLVDRDEEAMRIYFRRKIELDKKLRQD